MSIISQSLNLRDGNSYRRLVWKGKELSQPHRTRGVKVLKAVSSPIRLQILNFLFDKNEMSYTELMNALKMNPSRDAGRFAYHLKFLLRTNLVDADTETKKYFLTDLGKMIIDVADRVEKNAQKPKTMLVHTSHSTLEEFDLNKITNSLIKEAKMPPDQAQKTAKETEKFLEKSKTKFLTSPLIREIVNALLIEKGQEHYRHKLTRLGLPVHEVTTLLESKDNLEGAATMLTRTGLTVFSEYAMLNVLPRDIADAHASGAIHINSLGAWLLKPNEIIHDMRFYLQNGLKTNSLLRVHEKPPQTLESALMIVFNVLLHSNLEINEFQTVDHFNLFLAQFIKGVDRRTIKESLRLFIHNLNHHVTSAISLDLLVPHFMVDTITGSNQERSAECYISFIEESLLLAELIIEIIAEESTSKQLLNPAIIININRETLSNEKTKNILQKAHIIAAEKGILYFVNTNNKEGKHASYSALGTKFEADLTGDWETDTLRTGCLGMVTLNLPRIVHESEKEKTKFFEILKERYELATRALEIKARNMKQHEKTILPFLVQNANGDKYFRLESCSSLVNFAGLNETVESFCAGKTQQDCMEFLSEIIQNILHLKSKGKKRGKRLFPVVLQSREASERLAQLDIEKYGMAKIVFSGAREKPFYSTIRRLSIKKDALPTLTPTSIEMVMQLNPLNQGGNLTVVELGQEEYNSNELLSITNQIIEHQIAEIFTYNRATTYCANCDRSWFGTLNKCPICGAISTLTVFNRFNYS